MSTERQVYWAPPGGKLYRAELTLSDRGTVQVAGVHTDIKAPSGNGCAGCGKKDIVRWLGLRWLGKPYPLRLWARLRCGTALGSWDHCGCLYKLDLACKLFRKWWCA